MIQVSIAWPDYQWDKDRIYLWAIHGKNQFVYITHRVLLWSLHYSNKYKLNVIVTQCQDHLEFTTNYSLQRVSIDCAPCFRCIHFLLVRYYFMKATIIADETHARNSRITTQHNHLHLCSLSNLKTPVYYFDILLLILLRILRHSTHTSLALIPEVSCFDPKIPSLSLLLTII